jgi:hypothetical protein
MTHPVASAKLSATAWPPRSPVPAAAPCSPGRKWASRAPSGLVLGLLAAAFSLGACSPHEEAVEIGAQSMGMGGASGTVGAAANWSETSVPDAATVFAATASPAPDAAPEERETKSKLSDAQETAAMPLPGQANNHSAPDQKAKP